MKKNNDNNVSLDWIEKKLKMLREELESSTQRSEQANQLWIDLANVQSKSLGQGDETMLSIVIDEALNGVDISERYPEFYRRMLQYPEIFRAFLDAVEVLEEDAAGLLEPVSKTIETSIPNQIFGGLKAQLQRASSGVWLARWRQSIGNLNALFNSINPIPSAGYRAGLNVFEEGAIPLIRSEIEVEAYDFSVLLTAAWADDPDNLQLQLTVALMGGDSAVFPLSSLRAGLHWGDYSQVRAVNEYGQAVFPLLPIDAIIDKKGQQIKSDLQLLLHPNN